MQKLVITIKTLPAKAFFAASLLSLPVLYACSPGGTPQIGVNVNTGMGTTGSGTTGTGIGNTSTGTIGVVTGPDAIQDTARNGQRSQIRGNQNGVYGNTGGRVDSSRTDGQQMSNTGSRSDTLTAPAEGSNNPGMGANRDSNQSGAPSNQSENKSTKGTRNGNNSSGNRSNP